MAYRVLELTLVSAKDLKKVTLFSKMRVYAVASISGGDHRMPTRGTRADRDGDRNPAWNTTLYFLIPADTRGLALHVLLRSERAFGADRDVGEVFVPLDDLLPAGASDGDAPKPVGYQVHRPMSGRARGVLLFSYKFSDVQVDPTSMLGYQESDKSPYAAYVQNSKIALPKIAMDAVTAYPPAAPYAMLYAACPPRSYGYDVAPPYGYNAPPLAMYGYGAPPAVAQARQGGGMGIGLGLGLLGGAVGGMMLGDMISDFEADAAYDAGFNDGLGI